MKKLIALILVLVMSLSLVACGGPDTQPAIDAYNELAQNYNTFAQAANENLENWDAEDIEYLNSISSFIDEYGTKLTDGTEYTQEELDELVEKFNAFNAVIEEIIASAE